MALDDFEKLQEVFSLLAGGIHDPYDKMVFEADVFDAYTVETLTVSINGEEIRDIQTTYNRATLHILLKELQRQAKQRGDDWKVLVISYSPGEQVHAKYIYHHRDENQF